MTADAERADIGIEKFQTLVDFIEQSNLYDDTDTDTLPQDVIADVLHWAHDGGANVHAVLRMALAHYQEEHDARFAIES